MPAYSTPGVYVNETLLSSLAPNPTGGVSIGVFFGEADRGPTVPTLINDWTSYKSLYGDLTSTSELGYSVYHFFANGGRACYVQRIVGSGAVAATRASFPYYPTGLANASTGLFTVTAVSPGTWGNGVSVQTQQGSIVPTATTYGSFTVIVRVGAVAGAGGVEVERWVDLSLDPNASRYALTVVNTYSKFVRLSLLSTTATSASTAYLASALGLAAGTAGAAIVDSDYTLPLPQLDAIPGNLLLNAVGRVQPAIITAFVTKASDRGDSFVIIDPDPLDLNLTDIIGTASTFSVSTPGYAAQWVPRLLMVDPGKTGPAAIRTTFPGGAVAGLFVRTEVERTVAKAPAGYAADIRGALGLDIRLSDTDIGTLYDGTPQINSFKAVTGAGVVSYGARTLSKTAPDKFISVRRTLNYLKVSLKNLSAPSIFEPNDERLWVKLNMTLSSFLTEFWRSGGLKGDRAADAYYVVCDATNNTANSIDQGIVNILVGVALAYPAEFIVINISQWTGGSNVVESI